MNPATIGIIDDDKEVVESLSFLIQSVKADVKTYDSAEALLKAKEIDQLDCLVLDVRMPGMSGLELQERLRTKGYKIPIIFITGHGDIPMAIRAMKEGALDFFTKPVNNQTLLDVIHKAVKQNRENRKFTKKETMITSRITQLTPREHEILKLIVQGKLTKNIASLLSISQNTVEVHRMSIMRKMKARSLTELFSSLLYHMPIVDQLLETTEI